MNFTLREKCQVLIVFGFDPHHVEQEMGVPELELRFLDCLKLMRRQQQMQSLTLLSSIGSLLVKKGQQTFVEMLNDEIAEVNRILGETDEDLDRRSEAEIEAENQQKMVDAIKTMAQFEEMLAQGKVQRGKI